jgi:hypothetical protein
MRYRVRLVRAAMEMATVNVEARDEDEARRMALASQVSLWDPRGDASEVAVERVEEVEGDD